MNEQKRKSLDEVLNESEKFESQLELVVTGKSTESARGRFVAEITDWLADCARQGRFIPPASAERRALKSLLEYWSSRLRQEGLHKGIASVADFNPSAGIVLTGDCPYPGLEPYTENRRGSFFGRQAAVVSYVAHLEQQGNRILLIIGASGSGKSSLALAGILPRLKELHDGVWLFGARLTPGAHPVAQLAGSISQAIGRPEQASEIERWLGTKPGEALDQLAMLCQDKPLMLFVDQFEELLTLCRDAGEQHAFSEVLCALSDPTASTGEFSCRILLTLRSDHLGRFEGNSALKPLYTRLASEDNSRYLSAVGFGDIKRAVKDPAEEVGLRFIPPTLIDQLASQTAGLSNGLPLLQFALRRLWDTRPTNESDEPLDLITEEMVNALPDVERALGKVADDIFRAFSTQQQRICERLLLELVVLDESFEEPLRRRRNEAELRRVLQARFEAAGDLERVISDFVGAGLLLRFGEGSDCQLEVSHEALLRHWDHIYRLVTGAEVKERLHLIKQIGREASDWASRNRMDDYLSLRGERLHRAISCAEDGWLAEVESAQYVEACRKQEVAEGLKEERAKQDKDRADAAERARLTAELKAERSRRNMWRIAVGALIVLAVVLVWGWYRSYELSFAQKLAMAAQGALDEDSSQRSLLLAIEAARHGKTITGGLVPEVERALRSAIRASSVRASIKSYGGTHNYATTYTPDGSALAIGDSSGGITLWDVATGRQLKALFAHVDRVNAIAFSPDGRRMASGSADGTVVVWDMEGGERLHFLSAHVDEVTGVAFSRPDARLLATASDDGSVRLWDVSTGRLVRTLYGHIGRVLALAFGRDERQLVTAGSDDRVVVWDAQKGAVLYSFLAKDLFDVDLSADGSLLAVAAGEVVQIRDTATRGRRLTLTGHTNSVFKVRFSPDQRQVATASYDATVRVWRLPNDDGDSQQAREIARFSPETALLTSLAFSPRGDTVAATAIEGTATVWNMTGGGEVLALAGYESAVQAVAFSPDGKTITAAGSTAGPVRTWDLSGRQLEPVLKDNKTFTKAVAFGSNGVLAIGDDRDVIVIQPGVTAPLRLSAHKDVVDELAFSPNGSRLVSASHDGTAIVWELPSGKQLGVLKGHEKDHEMAVAYSPDGKTIATGSEDTIKLWQDGSWKFLRELKGHLLGILDLAFTADSRKLVTGSLDKTVGVWDVATGSQEHILRGHTDVVEAVAISGDRLATAGDDGIGLWDLRSLAPVVAFQPRSHGAGCLVFSPDGRYLAAGGSDGVVRVYAMHGAQLVELAENRVRRGWTPDECKLFLPGKPAPRSRYSLLDEADQQFAKCEFKAGEQLLREAKGSTDDVELLNAEIAARLATAFLWAASDTFQHPEVWAEVAKGQSPEKVALTLLDAAREKLGDLSFDPRSRLNALRAYQALKRARDLARDGDLQKSVAAFEQARAAGWDMPGQTLSLASQLFALRVVTEADRGLRSRSTSGEVLPKLAAEVEDALKQFPDFGPGHEVLAELYAKQKDFASAEKHYRAAAAKESSAEPLVSFALSVVEDDPKQAAKYANEALAQDRASDAAWFILGQAEYGLKNYPEAAEAFDQVSASVPFFADALNDAASIYFDKLNDDRSAYSRFTQAVQLAPNNLRVLSNYAEFLLASRRYDQAKLVAVRASQHVEAQSQQNAYIRPVMSFVLFCAELLSGEREKALAELNNVESEINAAKAVKAESGWNFSGIECSLAKTGVTASTEQQRALSKVLKFVESNGQEGTLDDMRQLLSSQAGVR